HKKYGASDLVILGISTDAEGAEIVKPFLKEMPIHYPVYIATPGIEEKFGGIIGLPTTFFYDKNGKQIATSFGLQSRSYFEEQIAQMIR
ncbi:MAG TPA: TlpA disulfide reductase family protein, partial [Acidobacteriota bacterium]|nr:TlpA disulfide reductase family protein [Acidobacteriota bacterium]